MSRFRKDLLLCEALLRKGDHRQACQILTDRLFRETFDPAESWDNGPGSSLAGLRRLCRALLRRRDADAGARLMRGAAWVVLEDHVDQGVYEFDRVLDVEGRSYESALREFDACIDADPRDAYAYAWRGRVRSLLGRLHKMESPDLFLGALEDLDRAVALDGSKPRFLAWRAQLKRYMEDSSSALSDLDRVLDLDPGLHWAYTEKAEILCDEGRHEEARRVFDRAESFGPKAASFYAFRGRALARAGFAREGLKDLDRALSIEGSYGPGYTWRAIVLYLLGRHGEALKDLERDLALNPRPVLARLWRGRLRLGLGDAAGALDDLHEALRIDSRHLLAFLYRAQALWKLGRWRQAQADLEKIYPMDPAAAWQPALLEGRPPRRDDGRRQFERDLKDAMAQASGRPYALALEGRVRTGRGQAEAALAVLDEAAALSRGRPWALAWRGLASLSLRRFAAAAHDLDAALKLRPEAPWPLAWRGKLKLLSGAPNEALSDFDAALKAGLRHPWVFGWKGEALRVLGRPEEALAALRRSTLFRFKPDNAQAFVSQAQVLLSLGQDASASASLARAFELRPELKSRLESLARRPPIARWAGKKEVLELLGADSLPASGGAAPRGGPGRAVPLELGAQGRWFMKKWPASQAARAEHEIWMRLLIAAYFPAFVVPQALAYADDAEVVLLTRAERGTREPRKKPALRQRIELAALTLIFGWGDAHCGNRLKGPKGWVLFDFEGVRRSPLRISPAGAKRHGRRAEFLESSDRRRIDRFAAEAERWRTRLEGREAAGLDGLLSAAGWEASAKRHYLATLRSNTLRFRENLSRLLEARA